MMRRIDTCNSPLHIAWQKEMMWAALEGSALNGRPLRMTSTGIFAKDVLHGHGSGFPVPRYIVTQVSDFCNANQMYFDMHLHYTNVSDAETTISDLVDSGAPWTAPNWKVSAEVGATADFDNSWFTDGSGARLLEYKQFFFTDLGNPAEDWDSYVNAWGSTTGQFAPTGPQLDVIYGDLNNASFTAICETALQYDIGTEEHPSPFLIEGLRPNQVRDGWKGTTFTPVKTAYINAAGAFKIDPFTPHSTACTTEETCPDCSH